MEFFEFFNRCKFSFFALGDSNWDLFTMQYGNETPALVAIAKEGTGAKDCFFGDLNYLNTLEQKGYKHGFTRVNV